MDIPDPSNSASDFLVNDMSNPSDEISIEVSEGTGPTAERDNLASGGLLTKDRADSSVSLINQGRWTDEEH